MRSSGVALSLLALAIPAFAGPAGDAGGVVQGHFKVLQNDRSSYAADAELVHLGILRPEAMQDLVLRPDADYVGFNESDPQLVVARDGKTAWASTTATFRLSPKDPKLKVQTVAWRVTDLVAQKGDHWEIITTSWSGAQPNAAVNDAAKAGKLAGAFEGISDEYSDKPLLAAFAKLTTDGLDSTAAARADLVAIGSGPGERTVGGAGFAKAWAASWVKHLTVNSSTSRLAPSGTTGWVVATVELAKGSGRSAYKIPFYVFCIFDKTAAGAWSLVHIQLSTVTAKPTAR